MRRILVVEDEPEIRDGVAEILELESFEVLCAENGRVGLEYAVAYLPDLIISDIMMPEMNGYELLDALQANNLTRNIPFVFLTAKSDYGSLRQGMRMGADDYLAKPFTAAELLDAILVRLAKHDQVMQIVHDQSEEIDLLRQVDQELSYRLSPHWVSTIAMDWALRRTHAKIGMMGIIQGVSGLLRIEYVSGRIDIVPTDDRLIPINQLHGAVIERVQPIIVDHYPSSEFAPLNADMLSALAVPMVAEENVIGVIVLEADQPEAFDIDAGAFLLQLANRAAISWQHAELFNQLLRQQEEQIQFREIFGRFVSKEVADMIEDDESSLGGDLRDVSILFCDIRGFTTFSELHAPMEVVALLNDYLSVVVAAAQGYGGIVNKFGGDSVLVIYGAPTALPNATYNALLTARQIQDDLYQLNQIRELQQDVPINVGIGINTGTVIAGAVGTKTRLEYTVIGDAVNLASRIESLTKTYTDYNILISEFAYDELGRHQAEFEFVDLGVTEIRGKSQSVTIYGLRNGKPNTDADQYP